MNKKIFRIQKLEFLTNYKFEFLSAIIFILNSLIHYSSRGYDHYKDTYGVDQASLENIADRIINGGTLVGNLSHGIGYPLLIAPFINIAANPFNIGSFFIFTFFVATIFKNIDKSIQTTSKKFTLIFFIVIAISFSSDMLFWIVGSSNSLAALLILLTILWSISPIVPKYLPYILGILSGLVFSSRYVDYVLLFPIYFSAIFNYTKIYKKKLFKSLLIGFSISFVFIFFTLIIHKIILGNFFATPYDTRIPDPSRLVNANFGENIMDQFQNRYFSWIIPNLYSNFIDYSSFASQLTAQGTFTVLRNFPILFFAPFSIFNVLFFYVQLPKTDLKKRLNITVICLIPTIFIWTIFYASGWAFTAHDLKFYCLRYFMGWTTLLVFITLYGLTLKPNFKVFLLSTIFYILIFCYPSYFVKNEFKDNEIVNKVNVYDKDSEIREKKFNLPIPFEDGKKSLLFLQDDGIIIGNDNYTNNLILGECNIKKLDNYSLQKKLNSCNFLNLNQGYLPEKGMEFLQVNKLKNSYEVIYQVFENGIQTLKNLSLYVSDIELENQGLVKLILDSKNKYKIVENQKEYFVRRNNDYYLYNFKNSYWPDWQLIAAEIIDNKNQILTSNKKEQMFCIWEVDQRWNYRKDRLCTDFGNASIGKYENEFQIDINNDGFINKNFLKNENSQFKKYINNNSTKILYKVEPIKMEVGEFRFVTNKIYKENTIFNIKLTRTGDGNYKNFPENVSLSCGEDRSSCNAYKIGRFNNLWRLWIKPTKPYNSISFKIVEIPLNRPIFWPIQYITFKNE